MLWHIFVFLPPNPYAEILIPNGIVLGGKAFEKYLGLEDGVLTNGINALRKHTKMISLSQPCEDTMKGWPPADQGTGPHQIVGLTVP